MSLRRPRIKSAVNLAALANGRRKDKVASPVPEVPENNKPEESVAVTSVTENVTEAAITPSDANKNAVTDIQNQVQENVLLKEDNHDDVVKESAVKIISEVNGNEKVNEIEKETTPIINAESSHTPNPEISNPEVSKETKSSVNDNPFSPPPARPAPIGRFKSRFRPNLNENRNRIRRFSGTLSDLGSPPSSVVSHGSPQKKLRTISCSSASETEGDPSENQTQDDILMKRPPPVHRVAVLNEVASPPHSSGVPEKSVKISPETEVKSPPSACPLPRPRRITEARDSTEGLENRDPTVFEVRKADHKKKFTTGIPERTQITMFDLIYYNPSAGSRMSNSSSLRSSRANSRASSIDVVVRDEAAQLEMVRRRLEEEAVDDVAPVDEDHHLDKTGVSEEDDVDAMPVPQVKVGPDGSIIIDESTTLIETTAAKRAKEDFMRSPLVFENGNRATNYGSWVKRKKTVDWTEKETVRFFKALSIFGTDFSMMENIFKRRSRHELKMKYKKEEKQNRSLVDKCLTQGLQFDSSIMESEEEEDETATVKTKGRRKSSASNKSSDDGKPKKKRTRKVKAKRGYYASSEEEDGEKEPEETRPPPVKRSRKNEIKEVLDQGIGIDISDEIPAKAKKPIRKTASKANKAVASPASSLASSPGLQIVSSPTPRSPLPHQSPSRLTSHDQSVAGPSSLLKSLLTKSVVNNPAVPSTSSGFAFPPALLAANPSLANAAPGSLVVVASPSSSSNPNSQLMHVFVLGDQQQQQEREQPYIISNALSDEEHGGDIVEERIVPVVMSEHTLDMSAAGRVRTFSGTFQH